MALKKAFWIRRSSDATTSSLDIESMLSMDDCLDAVYTYIQRAMIENEKAVSRMDFKAQRRYTETLIDQYVADMKPVVAGFVTSAGVPQFNLLTNALRDELLDWGVLTSAMEDPEISEIQGNDYKTIYVERNGKQTLLTNPLTDEIVSFKSADDMLKITNKLLRFSEVSLSRNQALQGGMTIEGFRVAACDPSVDAPDKGAHGLEDKSPKFVIRKYGSKAPDLPMLIGYHSITVEQATFLKILAKTGIPIVICGATGSGKTVLLQSILNNRVLTNRVAVVEDQSELNAHVRNEDGVDMSNTIQFEARPTPPSGNPPLTFPTFLNVTMQLLRMTPRIIVLGEMRTAEIVSQAITAAYTGHGLYSTVHADNVVDCITRITTAIQSTSAGIPYEINMQKVCSAIPFILSQQRLDDGSRKLLEFAEIEGTEVVDGKVVPKVNMLFKFISDGMGLHPEDGKLHGDFYQLNHVSKKMEEKLKLKALTKEELDILLAGPEPGEDPWLCTFEEKKGAEAT